MEFHSDLILTCRFERLLACVFALSLAIGMCRSRRPSDNAYCVIVRFTLESLSLHAAHVIHTVSNKLSDRERMNGAFNLHKTTERKK